MCFGRGGDSISHPKPDTPVAPARVPAHPAAVAARGGGGQRALTPVEEACGGGPALLPATMGKQKVPFPPKPSLQKPRLTIIKHPAKL